MMKMKMVTGLVLAMLAVTAGTAELKLITFAWDYPAEEVTADLKFYLHRAESPDAPLPWPAIAAIAGTNRTHSINVPPGKGYYYLTASNWWGESDPSNVAATPAAPRSDVNLSVRREETAKAR